MRHLTVPICIREFLVTALSERATLWPPPLPGTVARPSGKIKGAGCIYPGASKREDQLLPVHHTNRLLLRTANVTLPQTVLNPTPRCLTISQGDNCYQVRIICPLSICAGGLESEVPSIYLDLHVLISEPHS